MSNQRAVEAPINASAVPLRLVALKNLTDGKSTLAVVFARRSAVRGII
jgi:hypothetical protein